MPAAAATALFFAAASSVADEHLTFGLPVDCDLNGKCSVQNYFDAEPGPGASDYTCGHLTYDRHTGIDIRIANIAEMNLGVPVTAAAAGQVRGMRDGMTDVSVWAGGVNAIRGRECGNGVVIDHGNGWESQYCHLRRGSVRVGRGDRVEQGTVLGEIGMSGLAEFPHVHFEIRKDGEPVDPLIGAVPPTRCGTAREPLMNQTALAAVPYKSVGLINAGFSATQPGSAQVLAGKHQSATLDRTSPTIFFWIEVYGMRAGDRPYFKILLPGGGALLDQRIKGPDSHKARILNFVGKRRLSATWPRGTYEGIFVLERPEGDKFVPILEIRHTVEVR